MNRDNAAGGRAALTSLRTKLYYGFGSIAYGVKDNGFQTILLPYYNLVLHLPPQWVGAALAIALGVDAFLDPIVGHISDNLRTKWGRRHPLMYASALPVSLSYLLLWNPPALSQHGLFLWLIAGTIITRTFITFYEIPSSALVPELTDDYDERTSFLAYRIFFAWYGGMTMLTLAYLVFFKADATHKTGQLNPAGYHIYGYVAAGIMFCAILISAAGTHRFIPLFKQPEAQAKSVFHYARQMLSTLANRAFLILMSGLTFTYMATGLVFALNFYISTYYWLLTAPQLGFMSLALFIAVLLAFLIAPPMSRLFGKKISSIIMFSSGGLISIAPLLLSLAGHFYRPFAPLLIPALFGFATIGSALTIGSSVMTGAMIADVVEDNERRTGRRSEGLFFAGNSFLQKTVSGLGLLGSGLLLQAVAFPVSAVPGHVPLDVVNRFVIVYIVTVGALYTIGFSIISRFPITRDHHRENLRTLAEQAGLAGAPIAADLEMEELPPAGGHHHGR